MERRAREVLSWTAAVLGASGALAALLLIYWPREREEKVTVGAVEEVVLLPWGVRLPARIDTGAAISSLDARELVVNCDEEVEFRLPERYGGQRICCRLLAWEKVKSSNGVAERRPVVMMELGLGDQRLHTRITLNDRARMQFPVLVGRNTLGGRFVVDVTREYLLAPPESTGNAPPGRPPAPEEAPPL